MKKFLLVSLKQFIAISFIFLFLNTTLFSNNISVSNLKITGQNAAEHYSLVQFDIRWENSFRNNTTEPFNRDAAWVFVKFRVNNGIWKTAWLNNSGSAAPSGSDVEIGLIDPAIPFNASSNPGIGAFIYSREEFAGTFSKTGVQLRWNYGANSIGDDDVVDVKLFAIEMVYLPGNIFSLGDGTTTNVTGQFNIYDSEGPFQNSSENVLTLGGTASGNLRNNNAAGMHTADDFNDTDTKTLPADYPKGLFHIYCMKYEITQKEYVDFLNTLTFDQQSARTPVAPDSPADTFFFNSNRNKIKISIPGVSGISPAVYLTDYPYVACNYLSWSDVAAFLDWSGLRPMTELEFEKISRGAGIPVPDEFAWGSADISSDEYALQGDNTANEVIGTNYNTGSGNAIYSLTGNGISGPLRVGIFAGTTGNTGRITSGSSFYGIMELSGNLWERTITTGNVAGRSYTGLHGDGMLSASGDATVEHWPGIYGEGSGLRGGSWNSPASMMRTSDRYNASFTDNNRLNEYGGRGVRTPASGFITLWRTTSDNESISLPLTSQNSSVINCTVNWGDGTISVLTSEYDPGKVHTYQTAGDHRVEITGICEGWNFSFLPDRFKIIEIINWGNQGIFSGFKYIKGGFENCANLTSIASGGIPVSGDGGESLFRVFYACTSLTSIPADLFIHQVSVTEFSEAFAECTALQEIPADLFRNNVNVSYDAFNSTFMDCYALTEIPEDLFRYNVLVSDNGFMNTFSGCEALEEIPEGLFRNNILVASNGFSGTFSYCTSLTTIPEGLFRYNTAVSDLGFSWVFSDCPALTSVPADLFRYNVNVSSQGFGSAFSRCTSLTTIPATLFKYNTAVSDRGFEYLFESCTNLTSIPQDLFRYNTLVGSHGFEDTFYGCSSLVSLPEDLFRYNTLVSEYGFYATFENCSSLVSIPVNLFRYNSAVSDHGFENVFYNCQALTSIPVDLFKYNTQVGIGGFANAFANCSSITSIPADLFRYNVLVSENGFDQIFTGCTALNSVPEDLFRYNTSVTTFSYTFRFCSSLTSVPDYLFRYNTACTTFHSVFEECTSLQLNPDIFFAEGEESTRFLNQSIDFTGCFYRGSYSGIQGEAPALWDCDYGTGTPTILECFSGPGNDASSLSNFGDIPHGWGDY